MIFAAHPRNRYKRLPQGFSFCALFVFLLSLPPIATGAPVDSGPVEPGFSCQAARSTVEYLICDSQTLSRADAQMSAMYARARKDTARADALREQQRRWIKQRDACVQGQTLKMASRNEATERCLRESYAQRIRALRDAIAAPLQPVSATVLGASLMKKVIPSYPDCVATQAAFSDDARLLALMTFCADERGGERRVWLIDPARGAASPATPLLGSSDPHGESVRGTGTQLLWQSDTLFVVTSMETAGEKKDDPTYWDARFFSARAGKSPQVLQRLPAEMQRKVDQPSGQFAGDGFKATGDDQLIEDALFISGKHLFWLSYGIEEGTVVLRTRDYPQTGKPGPVREIDRGSWGMVSDLQFGGQRLIYPGADGVLIHDLERDTTRRLASTGACDVNQPLAWQETQRKLAVFGEVDAHPVLCILTLPAD